MVDRRNGGRDCSATSVLVHCGNRATIYLLDYESSEGKNGRGSPSAGSDHPLSSGDAAYSKDHKRRTARLD